MTEDARPGDEAAVETLDEDLGLDLPEDPATAVEVLAAELLRARREARSHLDDLKRVAADFEKKYPKVKINLVSERSGDKHYTALSNAIEAKKGVPDVAQVDVDAVDAAAAGEGQLPFADHQRRSGALVGDGGDGKGGDEEGGSECAERVHG